MKSLGINNFESFFQNLAVHSDVTGVSLKRVSENVTELSVANNIMVAHIVMPYRGLGIFCFGVPRKIEMSLGSLPKVMEIFKEIEFFKLNYCLGGRVEVFLRGKGKYAYLEEGMVAFDKNDRNTILSFSQNNYRGFGLYFNFDMMTEEERDILSFFGITKERSTYLMNRDEECFLGKASPEFRSLVESLRTRTEDGTIDIEYARMGVTRLLYLLLNDDVIPLQKSEYTTAGQRRLAEEAGMMMIKEPGLHMTAEDMAAKLGCTAPSLKKYFRKVYGVPMYTFLQDIRMKKAREDLVSTTKSISDIADEAGYMNQSKFCSLFKKTYGMTPSEYRRLNP